MTTAQLISRKDLPEGYYYLELDGLKYSVVDFSTTMQNYKFECYRGWEAILMEGDNLSPYSIYRADTFADLMKQITKKNMTDPKISYLDDLIQASIKGCEELNDVMEDEGANVSDEVARLKAIAHFAIIQSSVRALIMAIELAVLDEPDLSDFDDQREYIASSVIEMIENEIEGMSDNDNHVCEKCS
jgi:uncharacterized tellurite resistance protein B-like protein